MTNSVSRSCRSAAILCIVLLCVGTCVSITDEMRCPELCGDVCPPATTMVPPIAALNSYLLSQSRSVHEFQFNHSSESPSKNVSKVPDCSPFTWAETYRGVRVSTIALTARAMLSVGDSWTSKSLIRSLSTHQANAYGTLNGSALCALQGMGYKYLTYTLTPLGFGECFHFDWVSSASHFPDPTNENLTIPFPSGTPALQNTVLLGLSALALDARVQSTESLAANLFDNFVYVLEMMQTRNLFAETPQAIPSGGVPQSASVWGPALSAQTQPSHVNLSDAPTFHPLPPVHTLSVSPEMTDTAEPNTTTAAPNTTAEPTTTTEITTTTTSSSTTTMAPEVNSTTTTQLPTTEVPTTEVPTTEVPTTEVPTTEVPTTVTTQTTTFPNSTESPPTTAVPTTTVAENTTTTTEVANTTTELPTSTTTSTEQQSTDAPTTTTTSTTTTTTAPTTTTMPNTTSAPNTTLPPPTTPVPETPTPTIAPDFHAHMVTQCLLHAWMRGFSEFEVRFPGIITEYQSTQIQTVWNQTNQSVSQWFCAAETLAPSQVKPFIPFSIDVTTFEYNNTNDVWTQCVGLAAIGTLLDERCGVYPLSFNVLNTVMSTFAVRNSDSVVLGMASSERNQRRGIVDADVTGVCLMAARRLQAAYLPSFITEIDAIISDLGGNTSLMVQQDCERIDESYPSAGAFDKSRPPAECGGPLLSLRTSAIRYLAIKGTNAFDVIASFPTPPPIPTAAPLASPPHTTVNMVVGGAVGGVVVLAAFAVIFRRVRRPPKTEVLLQAPSENLGFY